MSPPGWPLRCNSRSVIEQPKPGGKIKYRPINDAGSKRKKRRLITEAVKKISNDETDSEVDEPSTEHIPTSDSDSDGELNYVKTVKLVPSTHRK